MNILFDQEQLLQLLTNLYVFTGMAANILDPQGRDIPPSVRPLTPFRRATAAAWPATRGKSKATTRTAVSSSTAATPVSARQSCPFTIRTIPLPI